MRPWWKILDRLDDLEFARENTMQQFEELKAAHARLIDVNKRLLAKVEELMAGVVAPSEVQTLVDEAKAAADAADAAVPPA